MYSMLAVVFCCCCCFVLSYFVYFSSSHYSINNEKLRSFPTSSRLVSIIDYPWNLRSGYEHCFFSFARSVAQFFLPVLIQFSLCLNRLLGFAPNMCKPPTQFIAVTANEMSVWRFIVHMMLLSMPSPHSLHLSRRHANWKVTEKIGCVAFTRKYTWKSTDGPLSPRLLLWQSLPCSFFSSPSCSFWRDLLLWLGLSALLKVSCKTFFLRCQHHHEHYHTEKNAFFRLILNFSFELCAFYIQVCFSSGFFLNLRE